MVPQAHSAGEMYFTVNYWIMLIHQLLYCDVHTYIPDNSVFDLRLTQLKHIHTKKNTRCVRKIATLTLLLGHFV